MDFHSGKSLYALKKCHLSGAVFDFDRERDADQLLDSHPPVSAWEERWIGSGGDLSAGWKPAEVFSGPYSGAEIVARWDERDDIHDPRRSTVHRILPTTKKVQRCSGD